MKYIDLHCDTLLLKNRLGLRGSLHENDGHVDFVRMREGGCAAQFFAVFLPTPKYFERNGLPRPADWDYAYARIADFNADVAAHGDMVAFAANSEDFTRNEAAGRMSAFLSVEDARLLEGDLANINVLYQLGVRLVTLTWNNINCVGYPQSSDKTEMAKGLTPFGKEATRYMQELGIIVDVSHLSDGGFWDVLSQSVRPPVASHSNARAVCAHTRNLTDPMIRALAEKGGGAGLNFMPSALAEGGAKSAVADMVRHLKHFIRVGGEDFPMLGSDFDGFHGEMELHSSADMPLLFEALGREGFTERQIEKIACENAARLIRESMK